MGCTVTIQGPRSADQGGRDGIEAVAATSSTGIATPAFFPDRGIGLDGLKAPLLMDTGGKEPEYLLITDSGRYLRLSSAAFHLLKMVQDGETAEAIAARFSGPGGQPVTEGQIQAAYASLLERLRAAGNGVGERTFGLSYRVRLLSKDSVQRISAMLTGAFRWPVWPCLVGGILLALIAAIGELDILISRTTLANHFWSGYVLFLLSLVAHELGHASACSRFGARPGEIGAGLYFIYPALYTDVTDAWRLRRGQRVVVDLGGIYFQLIVGATYVLLFSLAGWEPLKVAIAFIVASCLFSLNPFLKFDGYWILSDAMGVTDLRRDGRLVLSAVIRRLLGRKVPTLRWSGGLVVGLFLSGLLTTIGSAAFVGWILIPALWLRIEALPATVVALGADVMRDPGTITVGRVLGTVGSVSLTILAVLAMARVVRPVIIGLGRAMRGIAGRGVVRTILPGHAGGS